MPKIHGIEDHLLDQIIKYNGIGCFIEDFIKQAHQYGMLEERKSENMRDYHIRKIVFIFIFIDIKIITCM